MARSRLHIICGNCGCNDEFEWKIVDTGRDISEGEENYLSEVYITCKNCATLHSLSNFIPEHHTSKNDYYKLQQRVKELEVYGKAERTLLKFDLFDRKSHWLCRAVSKDNQRNSYTRGDTAVLALKNAIDEIEKAD